MMAEKSATTGSATSLNENKLNYFRKVWQYRRYLVIEPLFFLYMFPSVFNSVAIRNFPIEKACRVNLGYNELICSTILDINQYQLDCTDYARQNSTSADVANFVNITAKSEEFRDTVCQAQLDSHNLAKSVNGIRAPIASIFTLIILLFAGGWCDRYNKRKPCMIAVAVGEGLSFVCLLIAAIFFEELPMEFSSYAETLIPAITGGFTFMIMTAYSYMTLATPEIDRVFRFGIFAMFVTGVQVFGLPVGGFLFKILGYAWSFASVIFFQICAILYIIFVLKEVSSATPVKSIEEFSEQKGTTNLAYEITKYDDEKPTDSYFKMNKCTKTSHHSLKSSKNGEIVSKLSLFRSLFDITLVIDCIRFPFRKRNNNDRLILNLLLASYFFSVGPASEVEYIWDVTFLKLKWNGSDNAFYDTFSTALSAIGTFVGTAILSKILKLHDATIGLLSAIAIVISRFFFAFATSTVMFYVGGALEFFITLRVIAIRAIGSNVVEGEELSKMYAIFGICEPIGIMIFSTIFASIFLRTSATFPGAVFLFSEIFYIANIFVFIFCYFTLRRSKRNKNIEQKPVENDQPNSNDNHITSKCEITRL